MYEGNNCKRETRALAGRVANSSEKKDFKWERVKTQGREGDVLKFAYDNPVEGLRPGIRTQANFLIIISMIFSCSCASRINFVAENGKFSV